MRRKASFLRSRKLALPNGAILEIKVSELPEKTPERPHGLKYSLFYGRADERIIGYDNETGKGDHRHYRDHEERYVFTSLDRMIDDFLSDVRKELDNERTHHSR